MDSLTKITPFKYDDKNPIHRRALATAVLALEAEDLIAPAPVALFWATMARAGCTLAEANTQLETD